MIVQTEKKRVPALRFPGFEGDWEEKTLGEIFKIFNGYAFSSKDAKPCGVRWVKIADVGINYMKTENPAYLPTQFLNEKRKFILRKGDYVVALTRPILNGRLKIARIDKLFHNSLLNQRVGKLESKNYLPFVYSFLQRSKLIGRIEGRIAGTDPPNLSPKAINTIKERVPPLPEQQKIADFLTSIDTRIQQLTRKVVLLEQYKKGVMQQIFSQAIRFQDDQGRGFPAWKEKRIGKLLKESSEKSDGQRVEKRLSVRLSMKGVEKRDVRGTEAVDSTVFFRRKAGQFIYGKQNLHKGAMGIIPPELDGFESTQDIPAFNINSQIDPNWFLYFMGRHDFYKRLENISTGTGSKRIYPKALFKVEILVPSLPEQQKIADFLSAIDRKIAQTKEQLEQTQRFKKGLLQQLFV